MAKFQHALRQVTLKIVYYGPGLGGKTTNLVALHRAFPETQRGELVKLDTETERTLFFDYFPAQLGTLAGHSLRADLFTVPGQSFYNATRRAVLEAVDGIVFVADSGQSREEANLTAHDNMLENLTALGRDPLLVPTVYQWNKRDLPSPIPVGVLQRQLNRRSAPAFEAVATEAVGVWETQRAVLKLVLDDLKDRARMGRAGA